MMMSLIIMKIRFVCFYKNKIDGLRVKLHARSRTRSYTRSHHHKSCDHGVTIAFFFGVSSNKQVIVKNYLQLGKKPPKFIAKQEKNQCFY